MFTGTDTRQRRRLVVAINLLAAVVCLIFSASLRDISEWALWIPAGHAPHLPESVENRDATLLVSVRDGEGEPLDNALVRVFSLIDGRAYLAGQANSGGDGIATIDKLPHGETWLVVERVGMARSSSRVVLEKGERRLNLVLHDAERFEVVVVDGLQRPIPSASVTLHANDPLPYRARTDATGLARISGIGPPPYAVDVSAKGYDSKFLPNLRLDDSPLFVKLEQLGGIAIKVVDSEGKPVVDATIMVAGSSLWPARSAKSDKKGRVTISGLPRGFYDVRAEKGDLVSRMELGVLLQRGETKSLKLEMVQGRNIRIKVSDGEGEDKPGIANADVALVERGVSSFPRYGRTDEAGWVTLGPIADEDATVSARADGFVARSAVPLEQGQQEVFVGLLRGGVVHGVVVDDRNYPVEGAELEVVGVDIHGMPIVESSAISGFREDHFAFALPGATPLIPAGELGVMPIVPDVPQQESELKVARKHRTSAPWISGLGGSFRLSPVTPGRVRIMARHPSYVVALSEPFDLAPGGDVELRIVLRRGGILEGRVLEQDRSAVAGARIEVSSPSNSTERITYAAEDGSFAFVGLPADVVVTVARPDAPEHVAERLELEVPADDRREVEIILPKRREEVTIRVTDDGGYALDRVQLRVSSLDADEPVRKTLFTDDNGEAVSQGTRGLPLRIVAWRRGRAPQVVQLERSTAQVDIAMTLALELTGVVYGRDGPIENAELTLMTATGLRSARSDENGEFRIVDLSAGEPRLLILADGYVAHEQQVAVAGEPGKPTDIGRIELTRGGHIVGVVRDDRGEPIAAARIAAGRVPTYLPLGPLPVGVTATDRKGRFVLKDVEPGNTEIEVYKVGYGRKLVEDVNVRSDTMTEEVRIELEEDPEVDRADVGAPASLAVTLSESREGTRRLVIFAHVPLGGEAQRAGIRGGDRFLSYNGRTVRSLEQARRFLNGPVADDFVIELFRPPDLRWRVRVNRERLRR